MTTNAPISFPDTCKQVTNLDVSWQVLRWPRATSLWEHYCAVFLLSTVTALALTLLSRLSEACFLGGLRHPWLMLRDVPYWVFKYLSPNPMKLDSVASNVHSSVLSRENTINARANMLWRQAQQHVTCMRCNILFMRVLACRWSYILQSIRSR